MDLIELTPIADTMVGLPGSGLSVEQRKRLTIAVELVSNPSIVFADEPTSGGLHGTALRVACSCRRTRTGQGWFSSTTSRLQAETAKLPGHNHRRLGCSWRRPGHARHQGHR